MQHTNAINVKKRNGPTNCKSSLVALLLPLLMAATAIANVDSGSNDDFASAQVLPAGGVVSHDFLVAPGAVFTAAIDNSASGTDTTLGSFDQFFSLIATDDDSSTFGTGLGSSLPLTGNPDGTIHLRVSGFSDFDFDGLNDGSATAHQQTGAYTLFLLDGIVAGDVDVFAFTGLNPGQSFFAETFAGTTGTNPDTVLGWFDDLGTLTATNDDGGVGLFSQLQVTVPSSGTLFLGVSGFADFGFTGQHSAAGSYSLSLQAVPVPEPTGTALLLGGLVGMGLRRRR